MKRIFSAVILVAFALSTVCAFADITMKSNGANPPLGRGEIINQKGCSVTLAGQTFTVDCTSLSGVNWQAVGLLNPANAGLNWSAINYMNLNQVNWTLANIGPSGINWQQIKGSNLNQVNWVGANILANGGVNWEQIRTSFGNTSTSVNWQAFGV